MKNVSVFFVSDILMRKITERTFFEHITIVLMLSSLAFINSCCLPGDGVTQSSVRGRLLYDNGEPVPNEKIRFLVPVFYWKSNLIDKNPMYNTVVTYTKENGNFTCMFQPEIAPVTVCFVPPMVIPSYPCKPNFAVFLPSKFDGGVVTKYVGKNIKCQQIQKETETLHIQDQSSECGQIKLTGEVGKSEFPYPGESSEGSSRMRGWLADVEIVIPKED